VWDILLQDDKFRSNPALSISRRALDYFSLSELNEMHSSQLATCAMRREWTSGADDKAKELIKNEENMEYPSVSDACRVIETDTRTVIIDKSLAEAIQKGEKVSKINLMNYSVQIWASKIEKLALKPIFNDNRSTDSGMYIWLYDYEPDFLGYMKGVLKLEEFISAGGAII